jgi:ribosome modulation factor
MSGELNQERDFTDKAFDRGYQCGLEANNPDYLTMRRLLIRLHSARVAMNESAVKAALDDVDVFFREPNTN